MFVVADVGDFRLKLAYDRADRRAVFSGVTPPCDVESGGAYEVHLQILAMACWLNVTLVGRRHMSKLLLVVPIVLTVLGCASKLGNHASHPPTGTFELCMLD